jgi:hypothetical protein
MRGFNHSISPTHHLHMEMAIFAFVAMALALGLLLAAQGVDDTVQPRAVTDNPSSTAGRRDAD